MSRTVLDASAILALIHREPGADVVVEALPNAAVSTVNLAEVVARLSDRKIPDDAIRVTMAALGLVIIEFDEQQAFAAGALRRATRHVGLSLGDWACLALAMRLHAPAVTADRSWATLGIGVEVRLIR